MWRHMRGNQTIELSVVLRNTEYTSRRFVAMLTPAVPRIEFGVRSGGVAAAAAVAAAAVAAVHAAAVAAAAVDGFCE